VTVSLPPALSLQFENLGAFIVSAPTSGPAPTLDPPAVLVVHVTVTTLEVNVVLLLDAAHAELAPATHVSSAAPIATAAPMPSTHSAPINTAVNFRLLVLSIRYLLLSDAGRLTATRTFVLSLPARPIQGRFGQGSRWVFVIRVGCSVASVLRETAYLSSTGVLLSAGSSRN
jgi:hypothetical protein